MQESQMVKERQRKIDIDKIPGSYIILDSLLQKILRPIFIQWLNWVRLVTCVFELLFVHDSSVLFLFAWTISRSLLK
jgi:hypothetical protein